MTTDRWLAEHARQVSDAVAALRQEAERLERWGARLARLLPAGGRLLATGNGGSAAEAQHLTAELVGRYADERQPLSALALHAETSSLTAILNDYGAQEVFARQVQAHGRAGDVLVLMSTSGRSSNLLRAAERGRQLGLTVWAMTGRLPNPLAELADDTLAVASASTPVIQELHLVAVHALCAAVDAHLPAALAESGAASQPGRRWRVNGSSGPESREISVENPPLAARSEVGRGASGGWGGSNGGAQDRGGKR